MWSLLRVRHADECFGCVVFTKISQEEYLLVSALLPA